MRGVGAIGKHCNNPLRNNGCLCIRGFAFMRYINPRLTLTFVEYTNGKLLSSAMYRCSSLGNRHLHFTRVSDFNL